MTLIEDVKPKENITTSGTKVMAYLSDGKTREGELPAGVIRGKDGKLRLDFRPVVTTTNRSQVSAGFEEEYKRPKANPDKTDRYDGEDRKDGLDIIRPEKRPPRFITR